MKRKTSLLGLLLTSVVLATLSCSSGDKKEGDETSADVAEATAESSADGTPVNPDAATASDMASADSAATADQPPADGAAADANKDTAALNENPDPNAAANPDQNATPPTDTTAATEPPPPTEAPADSSTTASNDQQNNDLFGGAATVGAGDAGTPAPEKPKKSLAHIKDKPFKKGGQLLNTVYLAREGDTLDSVSEKIFGENKTKMLKKSNPHLKSSLNAGDKVYFNSPNRPEDNEKMMVVYEDQGLPPTTYVTKDGDTLKSLAMEWYGSENSYKEIYAINKNLTSTKELPAGTELTYWPSSVSIIAYSAHKAEPAVAEAAPPPPPVEAPAPANMPPPVAANAGPGAGAMPPPPVQNTMPPPPPDLNTPPLPPPPSPVSKKKAQAPALDNDTVMYAVAAGVLLIGGGAIMAIRRRSSKRNQGMTQI